MEAGHFDCIVVGAGIAGLWASHALGSAGLRVLLLESRDRLGGRIHPYTSPHIPKGVQVGASFVHGIRGNPLYALITALGLTLHYPWEELLSNEPSAFFEGGQAIARDRGLQLFKNAFDATMVSARIHAQQESDPAPNASVEDYLLSKASPLYNGLDTEEDRDLARKTARSFCGYAGADWKNVSLRFFGFEREYEGGEGLLKGGYAPVLKWLESQLSTLPVTIKLNEAVVAVKDQSHSNLVSLTTNAGATYTARASILTLPLGVLKSNAPDFSPALPPRRLAAINRLGVGLLNKIIIQYPKEWWTAKIDWTTLYLSPHDAHFLPALSDRAIAITSSWPINGEITLTLFTGGSLSQQIESLSDQEAGSWLHSILSRYLPHDSSVDIPEPLEVVVTRWAQDPWALGSYMYFPKAEEGAEPCTPLDAAELSKPLWDGRLGFAGEATDPDLFASVHGAMLTGHREAQRVGYLCGQPIYGIERLFPSYKE